MHVDSAKIKYCLYACICTCNTQNTSAYYDFKEISFGIWTGPYMFSKTYSDIIIIM